MRTGTAILKTRCGCSMTIEIELPPPLFYRRPLLPDVPRPINTAISESQSRTRDFRLKGRHIDGVYTYLEEF